MLTISEETVRSLLPIGDAIPLMREVFEDLRAGTAINQPRRRLAVPGGATLHSLAGAWRGYFGTKWYSTHPKHGAHFHFMLYESATGLPLALFDADWLGQIRTGAVSGYAADLLMPTGAKTLGIIGAGFQAASQLEAVRHVRQFDEVRVWSRTPERAREFAASHSVIVAGSAEEVVRGADCVITATNARDPVLEAGWVKRGALVIAMGSNQPARRELPAELVREALVITDSIEQSRIESGDLILALDEAGWSRVVELKDAQPAPEKTVVFKSNGLGVEDVAAGARVYERLTPAR